MVKLGEICKVNPLLDSKPNKKDIDVSFVPMSSLAVDSWNVDVSQCRQFQAVSSGYTNFQNDDVILAKITPCFENGKTGVAKELENGLGFGSTEFIVLRPRNDVHPKYIYMHLIQNKFRELGAKNMTGSAGQRRVPRSFVENYEIPLPPLAEQKQIVEELEAEEEIINSNKKLIEIFTQKIQKTISKVYNNVE